MICVQDLVRVLGGSEDVCLLANGVLAGMRNENMSDKKKRRVDDEVREFLRQGRSNQQIIDAITETYEFLKENWTLVRTKKHSKSMSVADMVRYVVFLRDGEVALS